MSYPGMPEDDAGECFLLQAKLINLLMKLLPRAEKKSDDNKMKKMRAKTISRILEYVDDNFQQKLTLGELAEKENLSLSYLSHAFKDAMGISFQEYLKQK
jgi:YesN/AraC family two-component response regulator